MEETISLTIRKAEPEDSQAIHHVFCSAIEQIDESHYSAEQKQAWIEAVNPESWPTRLLELCFYVATLDGDVVGFVSWFGSEIVHIYTYSPHKGVGTKLMNFALDSMVSKDILLTASLNAARFYGKFGFVEEEKLRKERGGVPIPCIRMRRHPV